MLINALLETEECNEVSSTSSEHGKAVCQLQLSSAHIWFLQMSHLTPFFSSMHHWNAVSYECIVAVGGYRNCRPLSLSQSIWPTAETTWWLHPRAEALKLTPALSWSVTTSHSKSADQHIQCWLFIFMITLFFCFSYIKSSLKVTIRYVLASLEGLDFNYWKCNFLSLLRGHWF